MSKRIFYGDHQKPPGYYRSNLKATDLKLAMENRGWLKLFQVVALLQDKIPPEARARFAELGGRRANRSLEDRMAVGLREAVRCRLIRLTYDGRIERHESQKDTFRWAESENNQAGQDPPRRRHAIKGVARR